MKRVTELRERRTMRVMMLKVARETARRVAVYWMSGCSRRRHLLEHVPQKQVHLPSRVSAVNGERVQVRLKFARQAGRVNDS